MTLVLCIIYMILSISLHTWHVTIHWSTPLEHYWTKGFYILYSAHRTGTTLENLKRHLVDEHTIIRVFTKLQCCIITSIKEPLWGLVIQDFTKVLLGYKNNWVFL